MVWLLDNHTETFIITELRQLWLLYDEDTG